MATGRGGKRPGAGRPKGSRNRLTEQRKATLREMAMEHVPVAIAALAEVAQTGTDAARVAAANSLLDRAFGKALQAVELSGPDSGPVITLDAGSMSTDALRELVIAMARDENDTADGG